MESKYYFYRVQCDFCGAEFQTQPAKKVKGQKSELPLDELKSLGWECPAHNEHLHFCPDCCKKRKDLQEQTR